MNVYDFDGTIYDGDSTIDFFLFSLKARPSLIRYLPRQGWGTLLYLCGRIDKTQWKEAYFSFLKGIPAAEFAEAFWARNQRKIGRWYLRQQAPDDVVISASPEFLLRPICRRLGIATLIASQVDAASGKFLGQNCRGTEKVKRLEAYCGACRIQKFYSDSRADQPLALLADQAFFVHKGKITAWNEDDNDD